MHVTTLKFARLRGKSRPWPRPANIRHLCTCPRLKSESSAHCSASFSLNFTPACRTCPTTLNDRSQLQELCPAWASGKCPQSTVGFSVKSVQLNLPKHCHHALPHVAPNFISCGPLGRLTPLVPPGPFFPRFCSLHTPTLPLRCFLPFPSASTPNHHQPWTLHKP